MANYKNKNGTNAADTLAYDKGGASVVYHTNAGNDTVTITADTINLVNDSGNDTITITGGTGHNITGSSGVDTLKINGGNAVTAVLGSGRDVITLTKSNGKNGSTLSAIRGGDWTDTFTTESGAQNYQLYGDAGDDIFNITDGNNLICWGGAANDTFNVTGGTGIKLRGGDSADIYNIDSGAQAVDMQLGYGNDEVNILAGDNHVIKGNLGINTLNLEAGSGHVITVDIDQTASKKQGYTDAQIKAGEGIGYGVDKVYIRESATAVTANLGDGKDVVEISAGSRHRIYTEGWGDTITLSGSVTDSTIDAGAGDDVIYVNGGSNLSLKAGAGADKVYLGGNCRAVEIDLGPGNDLIENYAYKLELVNLRINGSEGQNTYNIESVLEYSQLNGGSEADTIIAGTRYRFGTKNCLNGLGGDDKITCINNQYARIFGDEGNDTIICDQVSSSVVLGGKGADNIKLMNVYSSYISTSSLENEEYGSYTNALEFAGECNKSYIYGSVCNDDFTIAGKMNNCALLGGQGKDRFYVNNDYCQRNTFFGGAGDDEFYINRGSLNCFEGVSGANTFVIKGGSFNRIIGGRNNTSSNEYYVYDGIEFYNMLVGSAGKQYYSVDHTAKILIGTTDSTTNDVINLAGTNIKDCDIVTDYTNKILKIGDIYIQGRFSELCFGSDTVEAKGTTSYSYNSIFQNNSLGKTHLQGNLLTAYKRLQAEILEGGSTCGLTDIQGGLEEAYFGCTDKIMKIVGANCK